MLPFLKEHILKHQFLDTKLGLIFTIIFEFLYFFLVIHILLDLLQGDIFPIATTSIFISGVFISSYGKLLKVSRGRLFTTGSSDVDIKNSIIYYFGYFLVVVSFLLHLF